MGNNGRESFMRRITKEEYQIAKKYNLLFDGKNIYDKLNPKVKSHTSNGRTYIRSNNGNYYVTEGYGGIYDSIQYFFERENKKS